MKFPHCTQALSPPRLCGSFLSGVIAPLILLSWCVTTDAADFRLIPSMGLKEVYTDNVALSEDTTTISDFISVINPTVILTGEGARNHLKLYYGLQDIYYKDQGNNKLFHTLNIDNNTELLTERLFLNASVKNSRQNVGRGGSRGIDNLSLGGDSENVFSYDLSPQLKYNFSNLADLDFIFSHNRVVSKTNSSSADRLDINLASGPAFSRLLWTLSYHSDEINGQSQDILFRTAKGSFHYLLTQNFAFLVEAGYDDNQYTSLNSGITGVLWDAGFDWKPSRRTSLLLTYGRRFFGASISADFSYKTKRSKLSVQYSEQPDTERSRLIQQQAFTLLDQFGNPIENPAIDNPSSLDITGNNVFNEVFIRKRLHVVYQFNYKKHGLLAEFKSDKRDFQVSPIKETQDNANISWTWNPTRRVTSALSFRWIYDKSTFFQNQKYYILGYNLNRLLNDKLNIYGNVGYVDATINSGSFKYDEFRVSAGLNKSF